MDLLLEAIDRLFEVTDQLSIHRITTGNRFFRELRQELLMGFADLLVTCNDEQIELVEVLEVSLVERIEDTNILEQGHPGGIELRFDLIDLA